MKDKQPTGTPLIQGMAMATRFEALHLKRILFDQESKMILIIILISQILFSNGWYLFACLCTIYLICYHVQQPLKPGVFTLIAVNHFSQIIAGVWQANYLGHDINFRDPNIANATLASLVG